MAGPIDQEVLDWWAAAVVQEIWNEMGRQRITSLRELARRAGMTHTAVIYRMNGDARTGKRTTINVRDLVAFGDALGVEPADWLIRAQNSMNASGRVIAFPGTSVQPPSLGAVAKEGDVEPEGTEFD